MSGSIEQFLEVPKKPEVRWTTVIPLVNGVKDFSRPLRVPAHEVDLFAMSGDYDELALRYASAQSGVLEPAS